MKARWGDGRHCTFGMNSCDDRMGQTKTLDRLVQAKVESAARCIAGSFLDGVSTAVGVNRKSETEKQDCH